MKSKLPVSRCCCPGKNGGEEPNDCPPELPSFCGPNTQEIFTQNNLAMPTYQWILCSGNPNRIGFYVDGWIDGPENTEDWFVDSVALVDLYAVLKPCRFGGNVFDPSFILHDFSIKLTDIVWPMNFRVEGFTRARDSECYWYVTNKFYFQGYLVSERRWYQRKSTEPRELLVGFGPGVPNGSIEFGVLFGDP